MSGKLCIEIMPLQKGNSIYFEPDIRPIFNKDGMALSIDRAEICYPEEAQALQFADTKLGLKLHFDGDGER